MLRQFITSSEASRQHWASRFGISKSYLSLLENGRKQPSLALASRIEGETGGEVPMSSWIATPPQKQADAA